MQKLKIYNTLSKQKETFEPIHENVVGMYVCGPTVYSDVHIGNCRTFVNFDIVYRYLKHLGFKVRYVRNITDVGHLESDADEGEDKIGKKARAEQLEPMEIVQRYTNDFHKVLDAFNTCPPDIEPTATGHLLEQIEMIQSIIDNGWAYESNGSVYFDVKKYAASYNYGELSGRKIEDLYNNTRELDGQSEKRDPLDFALWKNASPEHIMKWKSPWGQGFPGWHLECSVMSTKYLGETFDIHGGGMDLKFPHHECEIAQNIGANGTSPVKYWMHANMLTVNGEKMSKSTGNSFLPWELFSGNNNVLSKPYSPMTVRFFMLQSHYRNTLDFSDQALMASEKGFNRLCKAIEDLGNVEASKESTVNVDKIIQDVSSAMNDDFNTPLTIAALFDGVKIINLVTSGKATLNNRDLDNLKQLFNAYFYDVLGLKIDKTTPASNGMDSELIETLIEIRNQGKSEKNYALSDLIRDKLLSLNIELKDTPNGVEWSKK